MDATEEKWIERLGNAPKDLELRLEYAAWLARRNRNARSRLLLLDMKQKTLRSKGRGHPGLGLTDRQWAQVKKMDDEIAGLSRRIDPCWMVKVDPALAIPSGLSELGLKAAQVIVEFLGEEGWMYDGAGSVFQAPAEATGEIAKCAGPAVLIVYTRGLLDECLAFQPRNDALTDKLEARLDKIGTWSELYDESTSMIHPAEYPGFSIGLG
jgi:hypothetical protein